MPFGDEKRAPPKGEESSPSDGVRGYCRICNRHYFFRHRLDKNHVQFHQHHGGVCQGCRYVCARNPRKERE